MTGRAARPVLQDRMLNDPDASALAALEARLPPGRLRAPEAADLEEPRDRHTGRAAAVARPRSAGEVAEIVRWAAGARVALVPRAGGTGLVAGQVLPGGPLPVVVSLDAMTEVRALHRQENVLVAEAGATLAALQEAAAAAGRLFPLSYASEGSARIGGALAVNSGGINVLRYGTARDLCLGIEAVLPDGSILNGLRRLRKDNTGYDLKNLLIGAEGTLGIITAASLRLYARPAASGTAVFAVASPAAALDVLARVQDAVGEAVSAFELISGTGFRFLTEAGLDIRQPFADPPDWSVLIELGLARGTDPEAVLGEVFTAAYEAGEVTDGVIAQSEAQRREFWAAREAIPEANRRIGAVASHDVSLPLSAIADFIDRGARAVAGVAPLRLNVFGHLGDGNLHYNVYPRPGEARAQYDAVRAEVTRRIHDLVAEMGGSFSAEHGVGRVKVSDLERYGDPARLAAMRAIKHALDPLGIMNPGAVLRMAGGAGASPPSPDGDSPRSI